MISDNFANNIKKVQKIISTDPSLENKNVTDSVIKTAINQIDLIKRKIIKPKAKILRIIDFALDLNR